MKISFFIILLCSAAITFSPVSFAGHTKQPLNINEQLHINPVAILDIFYQAIKRGELIVFGQKIEKTLLIPIQVEYVYRFDGSKPFFKVYSELKYSIAVPVNDEITLKAISATLDNDGHIIEVRSHVYPSNE